LRNRWSNWMTLISISPECEENVELPLHVCELHGQWTMKAQTIILGRSIKIPYDLKTSLEGLETKARKLRNFPVQIRSSSRPCTIFGGSEQGNFCAWQSTNFAELADIVYRIGLSVKNGVRWIVLRWEHVANCPIAPVDTCLYKWQTRLEECHSITPTPLWPITYSHMHVRCCTSSTMRCRDACSCSSRHHLWVVSGTGYCSWRWGWEELMIGVCRPSLCLSVRLSVLRGSPSPAVAYPITVRVNNSLALIILRRPLRFRPRGWPTAGSNCGASKRIQGNEICLA